MDEPMQPQQPEQPQHAADPVQPAEPAPGTVLPAEEDAERRQDEEPQQGEGGDGGEPYDGGEIPQVDAPMTETEPLLSDEELSRTPQLDDGVN